MKLVAVFKNLDCLRLLYIQILSKTDLCNENLIKIEL